jgi:pimeloyl-ACP methyl ester carboxylesterase
MPSVTANNIKINYIEQGAGDEVIVFIHGYSGTLGDWSEVLERLPLEYHAYAFDQRGHGQSAKPGSYQLTEMIEDIYSFSQKMGIEQFTYVGHSLGGKIGYRFALDHPEVLKAMMLVAPAPAHDFIPLDQRAGFLDMVTSAFGSPEGIRAFFGQTTNPPSEELLNKLTEDFMAADPAAKEECAVWWISTNLETRLRDIKIPALIVAGAKDDIPVDWERRYANAINSSRFELLEDSGHFIPMDNPQKFVNLLTSFINDVSTR